MFRPPLNDAESRLALIYARERDGGGARFERRRGFAAGPRKERWCPAKPLEKKTKNSRQLADPETATVKPIVFVVLYALSFFFANFGPNATTFIIPSEVFATKFRSTLHGFSSAMGKLGAVIGAFGFGSVQLKFGTRVTLVALAVVNFIGMLFTTLVPETKQMHLDDAASKSTSMYGRRVQKDAVCPMHEAEVANAVAAK